MKNITIQRFHFGAGASSWGASVRCKDSGSVGENSDHHWFLDVFPPLHIAVIVSEG